MALLLVAAIAPAWGQITHTAKGQVDQNAEKILKKASQKFSNNAVSFSVTMVSKDENKRETARMKAQVLYKKGRYRVTMDQDIVYCDGKATWYWNKEADEVTVNNLSDAQDDLMNPAALLSNYQKNFNAKYIRTDNNTAVIDLTPKKAKSYYKIRMLVNATTGQIQRMEMHNYDSTAGEYIVSDFKENAKCSDSDFLFPKDANPNVEIIDMR